MFASKPPTCAGRTLDLSRKDSDIRYLRHLGNSDIAIIHERKWKMKRIWPVVLCVAVIGCEDNVSPTAPSVELETVRGPVRGAAQNGTLDCAGTDQQFADGAIPDPVLTADIDCTVSRDRYIQAGWDTKGTSVTLLRHTSAGAIFVSDGMTAYGTLYKCNAGTTESIWHGVAASGDLRTNATIVIECAGEYEEPPPPPPPVTDLAPVMGVGVAPGNAQLVVTWTAVDTATGYTVQWTSGSQGLQHRRPAGHGHVGVDHEPHDSQPYQRHGIHGAGDRDPDGRHRRPAVGGGDGDAARSATAAAASEAGTAQCLHRWSD